MLASPLVKATLQATALATGSNTIAQVIQAHRNDRPFVLNFLELVRFMVLTLITTPPNYKWQQFLEYSFPGYTHLETTDSLPLTERDAKARDSAIHTKGSRSRKKSRDEQDYGVNRPKPKLNLKNTLLKWVVDCMTVGTVVNTTAFLVIMGALKAHSLSEIQDSVQKETIPIILAGYKVWPFASIVSFSFIPLERRIVFLSSIGFLWGIYMSLVAARV